MTTNRLNATGFDVMVGILLSCGAVGTVSSGIAFGGVLNTVRAASSLAIVMALLLLSAGLTTALPKCARAARMATGSLALIAVIQWASVLIDTPPSWAPKVLGGLQLIAIALSIFVTYSVGHQTQNSNRVRWIPFAIATVVGLASMTVMVLQSTSAGADTLAADAALAMSLIQSMGLAAIGVILSAWSAFQIGATGRFEIPLN